MGARGELEQRLFARGVLPEQRVRLRVVCLPRQRPRVIKELGALGSRAVAVASRDEGLEEEMRGRFGSTEGGGGEAAPATRRQ